MLLQRYVLGPHGPYLVFLRDEVERWRSWTGPRPDRPARRLEQHGRTVPTSPEMSAILSDLGRALSEQASQIHETREVLRQLAGNLAAIEREALMLAGDALLDVDAVPSQSKSQDRKHTG